MAIRNLVPRNDDEATVGRADKHWKAAYINNVYGNLTGKADEAETGMGLSIVGDVLCVTYEEEED